MEIELEDELEKNQKKLEILQLYKKKVGDPPTL